MGLGRSFLKKLDVDSVATLKNCFTVLYTLLPCWFFEGMMSPKCRVFRSLVWFYFKKSNLQVHIAWMASVAWSTKCCSSRPWQSMWRSRRSQRLGLCESLALVHLAYCFRGDELPEAPEAPEAQHEEQPAVEHAETEPEVGWKGFFFFFG